MRRSRTLALILAALGAVAASPAPAEFALREGRFALRPPKGWSPNRDPKEDARQRVYGVQFDGPRSADGVLSTITIAYYPPDNALFKGGLAEFLKRNLEHDERFVAPLGETTSPAEKTTLAGLPAQRFTRHGHEYLPPDRIDTKEVAVVEETYAAAAKTGFYVASFKASEQLAAKLKPEFNRTLAGLRLTAPPPAAPKP